MAPKADHIRSLVGDKANLEFSRGVGRSRYVKRPRAVRRPSAIRRPTGVRPWMVLSREA